MVAREDGAFDSDRSSSRVCGLRPHPDEALLPAQTRSPVHGTDATEAQVRGHRGPEGVHEPFGLRRVEPRLPPRREHPDRARRPVDAGLEATHEPVAEEFRRQVDGVAGPSGRVVFVTQPWVEMGALDAAAYLDHLHQVEAACRTAGLHLQLALHPAEDASKYAEFDVLGSGQLAELDREVLSADVLLGTDSTALLNAAAIHRVPALRVRLDPLQHHERALSPDQAALLDSFLPAPLPVAQLAERLGTA